MIEKLNYKKNIGITLPDGTVNGQGVGEISKMRYGIMPMSWNGCEIIAVYNFLIISSEKIVPMQEIAREVYPYGSICWGFFGTDPNRLIKFFRDHSVTVQHTRKFDVFKSTFKGQKYGIVAFWNGMPMASSLHTVCIENRGGKIIVYNRSNRRNYPVAYDNLEEFCDKKHFIIGYFK